MAKGKWIDKKQATTFQLVHRPQNDPLIHDESAPAMVLNPVSGSEDQTSPNNSQPVGKTLRDLSSELGSAAYIRKNEGEAANYGIYYDDTEYDYMQHMRELGKGTGEAVFIEANKPDSKGKKKMNLEDAIKEMSISEKPTEKLDETILPSKNLQPVNYQNQQNIPDAIAGFQPDMDPRLREALEALEDDAYVDEDDFDLFDSLTQDTEELDDDEFDETYNEVFGEEDGYESDGTAKPTKEYTDGPGPQIRDEEEDDEVPELVSINQDGSAIPAAASNDWMEDFKQFKKDQKEKKVTFQPPSEMQASAWTATTGGGQRKRRKGALSTPSMTSMSSSVLVRTEQLELLDRRYEVLQNKEFTHREGVMDDDMSMSEMSAMSSVSTVQGDVRQDFDNILDEFLGGHEVKPKGQSKKQQKKQRQLDGVARLDELRRSLGPARIKGRNY